MKKKIMPAIVVGAIIVLILLIIGISLLTKKYSPSKVKEDLAGYFNISSEDQIALIINREKSESMAKMIGEHMYLDYNFVHDNINPRFYWDANENILLYATDSSLVAAEADSNSYTVTKSSNDWTCPIVKATSDSAYIDIDFVKQYSNFTYEFFEKPNRLIINSTWGEFDTATIKKSTQLRTKGGIKSPILKELAKKDTVFILETDENWTKIMSADGFIGYVKNKTLSDATKLTLENKDFVEEEFTHIIKDQKISLAWHQLTTTAANNDIANVLASTKGVNVISPTWFYLNDNKGNLHDIASTSYVNYCHSQGVEVWALFSNLENKEVDSSYVLTHTSTRQNLVNQIIAAAIQYNLDGINLDFEALPTSVGDAYIQFVRELSIKCANNGIILSVDNYVPTSYTAFYNRAEQANFADYVVIMGYDEHTVGDEAGSVSSINWLSEGVTKTIESVPSEQVILGVPFYTRVWELTPTDTENVEVSDESAYNVSSTAYGMTNAAKVLQNNNATANWSEEAGQNYAEWTNGNSIYKVWLEDSSSLEKKLELVQSNSLAGAAYWKLGFETSDIWDTIIKYVN